MIRNSHCRAQIRGLALAVYGVTPRTRNAPPEMPAHPTFPPRSLQW
jgi:hypothetical protein